MMDWLIGTAHAAGAASGASAFPPFDKSAFAGQLFWLAIVFGTVYWMVSRIVLPRLQGILETRADRISSDLDAAAAAQKNAENAAKAYEAALAQAKANAQGIASAARDSAAKASDAERKTVEASLLAKLKEAEQKIATTKAAAMTNVEAIARDAAEAIVQSITGKAPAGSAVGAALASLGKH